MNNQRFVFKGQLVASIPLKPEDNLSEEFSWLHVYYSPEWGCAYYNYSHNEFFYCPLWNFYHTNCKKDEEINCCDCPDTQYFIELENGRIVPVHKLPSYGKF